jgi:hypothetical protein
MAAVELKQFADKVDADLKLGCGGLAKDLGGAGEYKDGTEACNAAIKAMGDVKAKLGAKATIAFDMRPPHCEASMSVMADCAGKCDASVKPGSAKVECEPGKLSGECSANCEGSCDMKAAAKCDGNCEGKCDVAIKGKCSGTCNGKCDGKDSKGACSGTCDGKCDGDVDASCGGKCEGSCKLKASAKCEGTCTGKCSAEFKEPKCRGEVKPPEMKAECKAHCDAQVNSNLECKPATVSLRIDGAADAKAAEQFKGALEKNLPVVLKVAIGMGERSGKMAANVKGVVEGLQGSISSVVGGSPTTAASVTACVAAPFKGAIDAAGSLKANVDVSVNVKASASASGSASGKAGG